MLLNLLWLFIGSFCGIMFASCLTINRIDEERDRAFQRGFDQGRYGGRRKNNDE